MSEFLNIFLHIDTLIAQIANQYGVLTYALLFIIIFCETGLVVMPFLPGDSLLFAVGGLCALPNQPLDILLMFALLTTGSIIGNQLNYFFGRFLNKPFMTSRFVNPKHLLTTQRFYEKHGGKAIIIARFMPIVRTFAPFIAGVCKMPNEQFVLFNIVSAMLWVGLLLGLGYNLGSYAWVQENFTLMIYGIVIVSILPSLFAFLKPSHSANKQES